MSFSSLPPDVVAAVRDVQRRRGGALWVLDRNDVVDQWMRGGFTVTAPATAAVLSEMAKMDGAVICAGSSQVHCANVQLESPEPADDDGAGGTRHRAAAALAHAADVSVVTVSEQTQVATLYPHGETLLADVGVPAGSLWVTAAAAADAASAAARGDAHRARTALRHALSSLAPHQ